MTNLFENLNKLKIIACGLRTLANTFIATNSQLATNLFSLADNVIEEMNTIGRKVNENNGDLISQTTQNAPNAALADVELTSKSIPTAALASNFCEQFNSNCACLNCHPIDYCVEDPCIHCDGPTNNMCEPPDVTDDLEFCEKCGDVIYQAGKVENCGYPLCECGHTVIDFLTKHVKITATVEQTIEQACNVMDSMYASSTLPSSLYDWQKEAWECIRTYINESQKHHIQQQGMPQMKVCMVCRTLLYFPLKKCPKCMRDTTTVLIES
jgi:hypothetical protein